MAAPDTSNPNILRDTFAAASHTSQDQASAWDNLYRNDFHPWDRGGPSLALADLLTERPDLIAPAQDVDRRGNPLRDATGAVVRRTALVPGCGRGHDVLLLKTFGYDVVGLDSSADGIRRAKENVATLEAAPGGVKPQGNVQLGQESWVVADFFAQDWSNGLGTDGSGKFDLIYDYTFLCALPPKLRPQWAKRMSELISHDGRLVCLEFPSGKPLSEMGPPWGVNPEVYEALLSHPGHEPRYNDDGTVIETHDIKPTDGALHRISLVKPQRTHKAGMNEDGSVRDFISVWSL
ncbi:putative thiol methyltransferase 2 [Beauveria bassiana D1-5]|uniref:Putative thiol methyltransferase 2 n=1 Tax=Beauveria bassiana D1-5 TaxID=1245745 RepID=A0A0A2VHW6_BEABA|nr:putative thiol methyltransferase 2 [Beauveria bassiana D1-5]